MHKYVAKLFLIILAAVFYVLVPLRGIASDVDENAAQDTAYRQKIGKDLESEKEVTLADKARHFEEVIRKRHVWKGFVRELALNIPGDPDRGGILHHNDNDGLWTSLYVAAMSFKYAATQDKESQQWAKESFHALEWLEAVTGIPGFPARSIVKAGDPKKFKYDGEWHPDSTGKWEWKGDTSSDELAGHFFAYSVFYDMAADEADKERVRRLVGRITDHLIKNDWYLVDLDGEPTRWGVWNPARLNGKQTLPSAPDIDWSQERALNSLEILSHLKTAHHITGDEKYQEAYQGLIKKHGYAENTLGPVIDPSDVNHSDVELAFCVYYPLLTYEKDSKLSAIYRKSLRATWEVVRPVKNPWWNFTYCAFIGEDCAIHDSVRTLQELPWDLINWRKENSIRKDIVIDPKNPAQSSEVLPYDQISIQRWNGNPYQLDTGSQGEIEGDGVLFLLPYWLGRCHKFIR